MDIDFGKIIKIARVKRGWTQEQLADVLGVTKVAVSCWEKGKRIPSGDTLIKLAIELDIVHEFFPGYVKKDDINETQKIWQAIEQLAKKFDRIESRIEK